MDLWNETERGKSNPSREGENKIKSNLFQVRVQNRALQDQRLSKIVTVTGQKVKSGV
jgi:hypothetical protein